MYVSVPTFHNCVLIISGCVSGGIHLQVPCMLLPWIYARLPFEFRAQLIPGHEAIGSIVKMGKNVKGFSIGDRCVADVGITVSC
jgi:NADPH:quinone reductase-like Zn-dependent oxidoreductase